MVIDFFRRKKPEPEEQPELEHVRRELGASRISRPEEVPEEELGEPIIRSEEITIPRRARHEPLAWPEGRPPIPPGLEPITGPPPEKPQLKEHAPRDEKLELILSKLDTIDARLRLIEEKLKSQPRF